MRTYRYFHYDVFTDRPFAGNQLAVLPDARALSPSEMQSITREMAFSETTFVLAPEAPGTRFRVRIFTPGKELPMAGHPTIGTVFALAQEGLLSPRDGSVVLGLGVGPTVVRLEWESERLRFAWMSQAVPSFGPVPADIAALERALALGPQSIGAWGLGPQVLSSGVPLLFVPLGSRRAVDDIVVDAAALQAFYAAAGIEELPVYAYTLEDANDGATVYSRMFAPALGVAEDPATGSASGPLGAYLAHHGAVAAERCAHMVNLQGVKMGRPSEIHIAVGTEGGRVSNVGVGGRAVLVAEGKLYL